MKMIVTFSKTVRVVVEAHDELAALKAALTTKSVKQAFDDAQTIFQVEFPPDDIPLGVVVEPRVDEIIT